MVIVSSLPHVTLYLHHRPTPILEIEWGPDVSSAELREAVLRSLALSVEYRVQGWLCNALDFSQLRPDPATAAQDMAWVTQAVLRPLNRVGLRRLALLESPQPAERRAAQAAYRALQGQLAYEVRYFETLAAARAWLARP